MLVPTLVSVPPATSARDALRTLLQKIESHGDPEIAGSQALAAFLLRPYLELVDDLARSRSAIRAPRAAPAAPLPSSPATG